MRSPLFNILLCLLAASQVQGEIDPIQRVANTTLALPTNPPLSDFRLVRAFGAVSFAQPLGIVTAPGDTNRIFVLEKATGISVIPDLNNPSREMFMNMSRLTNGGTLMSDSESGVLGLAFHPSYPENGYFYVFYTPGIRNSSRQTERHNRVSRFQVDPDNPNRGLLESELVLLSQVDQAGNHNGGDLHFGPDGYLYVALGDEGGANDQFDNARHIDKDFFAGILRIDVDNKPGNLPPNPHPATTNNYSIPADNPFVDATSFNGSPVNPTQLRTEFWAVGLRNPWRMAFDPATGALYCGDVGQGRREEINIIKGGLDYGWSYREGSTTGPRPNPPRGLVFEEPWIEYNHGSGLQQGNSVTGGVVYRGTTFDDLYEHYIFGDYVSGNIWSVNIHDKNPGPFRHLVGHGGIAGFGTDPRNGDVLMADIQQGTIWKLERTNASSGTGIPELLSETGAFDDLSSLKPHPGIVAYEPALPFWSDGALKSRWFSIPDPMDKITFSRDSNWQMPSGSIWIKHFELELQIGNPKSRRRLETRFIVKNDDGVYGLTYRWNENQTDAILVPAEGMNETFQVTREDGVIQDQIWRYPGRGECLNCHTSAGGGVLGFDSAQLNHDYVYENHGSMNQIKALADAGYFQNPDDITDDLPKLARMDDEASSLEYRVRSYLESNCSQCHQPATGFGLFDTRISTRTADAGLVEGGLRNLRGDATNRVIARGDLDQSVLYQRIITRGPGQMPPIGSNVPDVQAIDLIRRWIQEDLIGHQTYGEWAESEFTDLSEPRTSAGSDFDGDGASNYAEFLAGTDPKDSSRFWNTRVDVNSENLNLFFKHPANRLVSVEHRSMVDSGSWTKILSVSEPSPLPSRDLDANIRLDLPGGISSGYYRLRLEEP